MKINVLKAFIASTSLMLGAGIASAASGTGTDNLYVKLKITNGCTVNFDRGGEVNLGTYANLLQPVYKESSFSVRCTPGLTRSSYKVALNGGQFAEGEQRHLKSLKGGNKIKYDVFRENINGQKWGTAEADLFKGELGTTDGSATGGSVNRHTFVVSVPAQEITGSSADEYMDMLTATVTYEDAGTTPPTGTTRF